MIRNIVICVLMISLLFISACSGPAEEPLTRSSSELLTSDASLLELIIIDDIKSYILDPSEFTHNIELPYDVEQIEVIATPEDMKAIVVLNGKSLESYDPTFVILNPPGTETTLNIDVSSNSGKATDSYTIYISREASPILSANADLTSLSINYGNMSKDYNPEVKYYEIEVDHDVDNITINAGLADTKAELNINGNPANSGDNSKVALSSAGTITTIGVLITAEDSNTSNEYEIRVKRGSAPLPPSGKYVGSRNSDKYHYPSCGHVESIKLENRVWFNSVEEAVAAGYIACGGCKPPGAVAQTPPSKSEPEQFQQPATPTQGSFVGSKNSDKYHYPSCGNAKNIKPGNLITFNSAAEARAAGYVPCKNCKPPQ